MLAQLKLPLASIELGISFQQVLPYALAGILAIIIVHLLISLAYRGASAERRKWNPWDYLIYLGVLSCVGVLAFTSFAEVMRRGVLDGWPLFFHMFGAGAFTAVLPLLVLTWADANRLERRPPEGNGPAGKFSWFPKLMFWLIIIGGLVVTMTMLISMLPIFGTDGLHVLLDLHRYSGLLVVAATILHLYSVTMQKLGLS